MKDVELIDLDKVISETRFPLKMEKVTPSLYLSILYSLYFFFCAKLCQSKL